MDMNARFGVPFAFYLMTLSANAKDIPSDCKRFFDRAKLPADSDCAAKCGILMTDMATFNCPEFCDLYCNNKRSVEGDEPPSEFSLSGLYPGLTNDEQKMIKKNPKQAAVAYWLSWRAERLCASVYLVSDTNDESDACRHYVWASLMNRKFGPQVASEFLDAHEQNPDEPQEERAMDLANNRRGILASSESTKNRSPTDQDIVGLFQKDLKSGKLVVLRRNSP